MMFVILLYLSSHQVKAEVEGPLNSKDFWAIPIGGNEMEENFSKISSIKVMKTFVKRTL